MYALKSRKKFVEDRYGTKTTPNSKENIKNHS